MAVKHSTRRPFPNIKPRNPMLDAIDSAYGKLPQEEAQTIDKLADHLVASIKGYRRRYVQPQFGFSSALEVIAKLGIYLNKNQDKEIE